MTIGFKGSKKNAIDNAFHTYGNPTSTGDKREGWWGATDFQFRQIQAYKDTADAAGWGTVCVPYAIAIPENTTLYEIAGIIDDNTKIAIRKVEVAEAGTPYIYHTTGTEVIFFESGERAKSAKTNVNGLRGQFTNQVSQYPLNSIVLIDGVWENVTQRSKIKDFSGFIYQLKNVPVLESWSGETMPTKGVPTGIKNANADNNAEETVYTIGGVVANKNVKGIQIKHGKKVAK